MNQEQRVIKKLRHDGYITRNEALRNYLSRLSAIILSLREQGWDFDAEYIKSKGGKDYKYVVTKMPSSQMKLL